MSLPPSLLVLSRTVVHDVTSAARLESSLGGSAHRALRSDAWGRRGGPELVAGEERQNAPDPDVNGNRKRYLIGRVTQCASLSRHLAVDACAIEPVCHAEHGENGASEGARPDAMAQLAPRLVHRLVHQCAACAWKNIQA